jgi:hypothetical protein
MSFVIWCWDDPVVRLNGETVSIEIGVHGSPDVVRAAVDLAETIVTIPPGVTAEPVSTTNEFFRETVRFLTLPGADAACIEVRVHASRVLPVALRVNGWVVAEGTTAGPLTAEIPVAQYA